MTTSEWVRPPDWLPLPTIDTSEEKIALLVAVRQNTPNYISFQVSGNFTVDYGDGNSPTNYTSATTVNKQLLWADYSATPTTSEGWRQAVITITPQAGHNLTSINFNKRHTTLSQMATTGVMDMRIVGANITSFTLAGNSPVIRHPIQQFEQLGSWGVTNFYSLLRDCFSLVSVPSLYATGGTDFQSTFEGCYSLKYLPANLDTSSGTSFVCTFKSCCSLESIPAIDTSSGTDLEAMFDRCYSITEIPLLDTSASTDCSYMFYNCFSLVTIPLIDTSSVTDFTSMFRNCYSLTSIPTLDTSSGTTFTSMFEDCLILIAIPALSSANGTTFSSMVSGTTALQSIELTGCRRAVSLANCSLSSSALDAFYTSLGTASGSQTITVSGNYGTSGDTPSIATSKGFTVSGS